MPAPISIAAGHCSLTIVTMRSGMQATTRSSSIQRLVRTIVLGSLWTNQSRNLAIVASTESPRTMALMTTA